VSVDVLVLGDVVVDPTTLLAGVPPHMRQEAIESIVERPKPRPRAPDVLDDFVQVGMSLGRFAIPRVSMRKAVMEQPDARGQIRSVWRVYVTLHDVSPSDGGETDAPLDVSTHFD